MFPEFTPVISDAANSCGIHFGSDGRFSIMTDAERFWKKVNKNGPTQPHCPELGPCWQWTGSRRKTGHGHFEYGSREPGCYRGTCAHRFSYETHHGDVPAGHGVLHRCDNGACVNPEHLFTGTQKTNLQDAAKKKRTTHGEKNSHAVLTAEKVSQMRQQLSAGVPRKEIAVRFGIARSTANQILRGETWVHVI